MRSGQRASGYCTSLCIQYSSNRNQQADEAQFEVGPIRSSAPVRWRVIINIIIIRLSHPAKRGCTKQCAKLRASDQT